MYSDEKEKANAGGIVKLRCFFGDQSYEGIYTEYDDEIEYECQQNFSIHICIICLNYLF